MKLELGAGHRPTRGYTHQDLNAGPHIEHVGEARMLELPDNSLDEVLALGFVEHLTFDHARDTFRNVHRMLKPSGVFLFDVPDYPIWAGYYLAHLAGNTCPKISMDHVRKTLFGWGRFPGDHHLYGWDSDQLAHVLVNAGYDFRILTEAPIEFTMRTHRDRFAKPEDAHLYVIAAK